MSSPFLGEIRMFAGNFAPQGWMFCQGQTLAISQYDALFSLLGTTYGGDGTQTFALPDLRGRIPLHQGGGLTIGQRKGSESVTLTTQSLPAHTHTAQANTGVASDPNPQGNLLGESSAASLFQTAAATTAMAPAVSNAGGSQPHENMQPYLCLNFIIALEGIYPQQG